VNSSGASAGQVAGATSLPVNETYSAAPFPRLSVLAARPGVYRFRFGVYGPQPTPSADYTAGITGSTFEVQDRAGFSVAEDPLIAMPTGTAQAGQFTAWILRGNDSNAWLYDASDETPTAQASLLGWLGVMGPDAAQVSFALATDCTEALGPSATRPGSLLPDPFAGLEPVVVRQQAYANYSLSGVDGLELRGPYGAFAVAMGGEGFEPASSTTEARVWSGLAATRPFRLVDRALSVYPSGSDSDDSGSWPPPLATANVPITVRVQLAGPDGAPVQGEVVEATALPGCRQLDDTCLANATGGDSRGEGAGVTDDNGIAEVQVVLDGPPGLVDLVLTGVGAVGIESSNVWLNNLAATVVVKQPLQGIDDGGDVPAAPLTPAEFQVDDWVNVPKRFRLSGSFTDKLTDPGIQIVDEFGSSLPRSAASPVAMHIVTCGGQYMADGTSYPPVSGCSEFTDWNAEPPVFICPTLSPANGNNSQACEQGYTQWTNVQFESNTQTGFYYIFYASDGLLVAQQSPLYVDNVGGALPAQQLAGVRIALVAGAGAGLLLSFGNYAPRDMFWNLLGLGGAILYAGVVALYIASLIRAYGGPRLVPPGQAAMTALIAANAGGLVAILSLHVLLGARVEYFSGRQRRYLAALHSLFVPIRMRRNSVVEQPAKVHPEPTGGAIDAVLRAEAAGEVRAQDALRRMLFSAHRSRSLADLSGESVVSAWQKKEMKEEQEAAIAVGRRSLAGVLRQGFMLPSRLLQGIGVSMVAVLVLLALMHSGVTWSLHLLELVRVQEVQYHVSLGTGTTSMDPARNPSAVPSPPYADRYDVTSMTYTILASFYSDGRNQYEALRSSIYVGSLTGCAVAAGAFCFAWWQIVGSYARLMHEMRTDAGRARTDHWKYPLHEAAGYVGKQVQSLLPSCFHHCLNRCFSPC